MMKLHEYLNHSSKPNKSSNNKDDHLWSILLNQSRGGSRKSTKKTFTPHSFFKMSTRKIHDPHRRSPSLKRGSAIKRGIEELK